jgi:hypothetical protein
MIYQYLSLLTAAGLLPGYAPAQPTPPFELAEMSLEELMSVIVNRGQRTSESLRRWSISYGYRHLKLEGYRRGTNDLSFEDVLWQPGVELYFRHTDDSHGRDNALLVPGSFPYPAGITNPKNYGANKAGVPWKLRACVTPDCNQHATFEMHGLS